MASGEEAGDGAWGLMEAVLRREHGLRLTQLGLVSFLDEYRRLARAS